MKSAIGSAYQNMVARLDPFEIFHTMAPSRGLPKLNKGPLTDSGVSEPDSQVPIDIACSRHLPHARTNGRLRSSPSKSEQAPIDQYYVLESPAFALNGRRLRNSSENGTDDYLIAVLELHVSAWLIVMILRMFRVSVRLTPTI